MADDWAPGDLALCIKAAGPRNRREVLPGYVDTVTKVVPGWSQWYGRPAVGLYFQKLKCPAGQAFDTRHWIKIEPLTEDETREFEADLRHDTREPLHLPAPYIFY